MLEVINRKLEAAKAKIEEMQSKVNVKPKEHTTKNMCPPIPEAPDNKGVNDDDVPGVITGGPKRSNKHKQV